MADEYCKIIINMNNKLLARGLFHALGVFIYVLLVVTLMTNLERIFGSIPARFWGPVAMLLLFVVSAAVVGLLIFGKPVMMYLNGSKPDAIKMLLSTLGWLVLIVALVFVGILYFQT